MRERQWESEETGGLTDEQRLELLDKIEEAQTEVAELRQRADKAQDKLNDKWEAKHRRDENEEFNR